MLTALLRRRAPDLDEAFVQAVWDATTSGRATYADVHPDPDRWVSAVFAASDSTLEKLRDVRAADLWLATALADGDAAAMSIFEAELMPEVDRALSRFVPDDDERAELRQRVRIRLLVSEGSATPPRIATYSGRGRLAGWIRTAAGRLALNLRQAARDHAPLDEQLETALPESPELAVLRAEHRALFRELLETAFRGLPESDRTLIRLRYAQGMTAVSLARAYGVHESTLSRRLASARSAMAATFGALAAQRLGLNEDAPPVEAWQFLQSRVEWSLESLLKTRDG